MSIIIKIKVAVDNLTANISSAISNVLARVNWLYVRLAVIAIGVIPEFFVSTEGNKEELIVVWAFVPVAFLSGIIGLQFIIGMQAFNPDSAKTWLHPSWKHNPFNLKQPLQFFHLGGWYMLASSIPYLSSAIEGNQEGMFLAATLASCGLGMLLGVRLSVLIYRRKFSNA